MENASSRLESYIELLLNDARPKLIAADKGGGSKLYNQVVEEFALMAHHVYWALEAPARSVEKYHDKDTKRVLLDPRTVLNRAQDTEASIEDLEFWKHGDMIKTLCDYLDLRSGGGRASA
jgi:hypothetical protein